MVYGQDVPQVSIVQPINGTVFDGDKIKVDYIISGAEPKSVKILLDGRPAQLLVDVKIGENSAMVNVPEHDCKISIVVQNDFGASVPAVVHLTRSEHIFKPSLFVLAIGVSKYTNPDLQLQFASKDATDFSQSIYRQEGLLYEKVELKLLTDEEANAENIREGLYWLQAETKNRDVAMLYMAGHGVHNNVGDFFFMPVNANIDRINSSCVGYTEIKGTIDAIAGKIVVFMDACHSGNILGNSQRRAANISQAVSELTSAENGAVVFTSSTGRQFSLENPEWNNGAFTKALVEGLNGAADLFNRKTITVKNLDSYVANRVKELTKGQQAPTTIIPSSVPDFPLGVVSGDVNETLVLNRLTSKIQENSQVSATQPEDPKDLGDKYFFGNEVQRDCNEAEKWYRKSAEQGNAYAQNKLGEMYVDNPFGCHIKTDHAEALKWFKISAEQGFAAAQFNMGMMYQYGLGVRGNLKEAVKWYRLSAEQGNQAAKIIVEQWDKN